MLVIAPCNDFIDNQVLREYSICNQMSFLKGRDNEAIYNFGYAGVLFRRGRYGLRCGGIR